MLRDMEKRAAEFARETRSSARLGPVPSTSCVEPDAAATRTAAPTAKPLRTIFILIFLDRFADDQSFRAKPTIPVIAL